MHLTHKRVPADRDAGGDALRPRSGKPPVRPARGPLTLVRPLPDHGYLGSDEAAASDRRRSAAAGQLAVRSERRRSELIVWLSGVLDRATANGLDGELDVQAIGARRLVVDLTELEFIDRCGLETLMRIHRRRTVRGDRLCFRHGPHVAQRPLGLIRTVQLRSEWAPRRSRVSDEDSFFALAMACADVDQPSPGDRPGAA